MKFKSYSFSMILLVAGLFFIQNMGCSDSPVSPNDNENPPNETVQKISDNSTDIYNTVSSFRQVSDLIQGPDAFVDMEIPEVENPQQAMKFAKSVQEQSLELVKNDVQILNKARGTSGDSVIWDITYHDDKKNITFRSSLIYDDQTGIGRLFFVGKQYPENHPLEYDSTEIIADLNSTLFDNSDDVLTSVENLKRFKPGHLIQEQKGKFEVDPYVPGNEPTGGILTSEITYSGSSFVSSTHAQLEYHEGEGGGFSKTVRFSDDRTHSVSITFHEDGTGTFEETRRDGTHIEGTFDSAEEDGQGSFSKTITFPSGHNPVSISESGEFTLHNDSTISGSFEREVLLKDGTKQTESVTVEQTLVGDVKTTTLNVEAVDGGSGFITIVETPDVDQASGEWTNPDGTFLVFTAEYYPDDSAHLEFSLYASEAAFENGEDPIATGVFDFYPGGSGQGTVTEDGTSYEVTIDADGSVTVTPAA